MLEVSFSTQSALDVALSARLASPKTQQAIALPTLPTQVHLRLQAAPLVDALCPSARSALLLKNRPALFLVSPRSLQQPLPATTILAKICLLRLKRAVLAATSGESLSFSLVQMC